MFLTTAVSLELRSHGVSGVGVGGGENRNLMAQSSAKDMQMKSTEEVTYTYNKGEWKILHVLTVF